MDDGVEEITNNPSYGAAVKLDPVVVAQGPVISIEVTPGIAKTIKDGLAASPGRQSQFLTECLAELEPQLAYGNSGPAGAGAAVADHNAPAPTSAAGA